MNRSCRRKAAERSTLTVRQERQVVIERGFFPWSYKKVATVEEGERDLLYGSGVWSRAILGAREKGREMLPYMMGKRKHL
jgi:hypothetical protein